LKVTSILKTTSKSTPSKTYQEQAQILIDAGDNPELMIAICISDSYSDNSTLQKNNGEWVEIFEYSNDPEEELFNVRFSLVGPNRKLHFEKRRHQ
jgi:hypothetical protein